MQKIDSVYTSRAVRRTQWKRPGFDVCYWHGADMPADGAPRQLLTYSGHRDSASTVPRIDENQGQRAWRDDDSCI